MFIFKYSNTYLGDGVSLSEPLTIRNNGTCIAFTKIYMEIWIIGISIMCSQKCTFKIG